MQENYFTHLQKMLPYADEAFEKFYDNLLSDPHFEIFFESQEQIKALIQKQKANFIESIGQDKEYLKSKHIVIGEHHYDLRIPYIDFMAGMDILEEIFIKRAYGLENALPLLEEVFSFFKHIRAYTAKGYLNRMIEEDLRDIERLIGDISDTSDIDLNIIERRIKWLKHVLIVIKEEKDFKSSKILASEDTSLWIGGASFLSKEEREYLDELNRRIEISANDIFYFLTKKEYEEVLPLYTNLLAIYKLTLILSNSIVYAISRHTIQHLKKDSLTGLHGRRAFNEVMKNELAYVLNDRDAAYSLIMLDMDRFKYVNDTYGHVAGDIVLQKVGKIIQNHIRTSDYGFRIGGEEMTIILHGARINTAMSIAEKVRLDIKQESIELSDGRTFQVSASFGVLEINRELLEKTKNPEEIVEMADKKLYLSKKEGRDRVSC